MIEYVLGIALVFALVASVRLNIRRKPAKRRDDANSLDLAKARRDLLDADFRDGERFYRVNVTLRDPFKDN